MISSADLGGLMAMMPAFATDDAADIHATVLSALGYDIDVTYRTSDGRPIRASDGEPIAEVL